MIEFIGKPYPNEILYSWIARYHTLSAHMSPQYTSEALLDKRVIYPNIYYPVYLDFLVEGLPTSWEYTSEILIDKFSIFPFFKPFLIESRAKKAVKSMKNGSASYIRNYMGLEVGGIFKKDVIKICSKCYEKDMVKHTYIEVIKSQETIFV